MQGWVVGAGGFGREVAAWYEAACPDSRVAGYLDDDAARHGTTLAGLPVVGDLTMLGAPGSVNVLVAIGSPAIRRQVDVRLRALGHTPMTLVHPEASVGPRCTLADGVIVGPGAVLTVDVTVGRCAIVYYGSLVGHETVIGDHAFVAPGVSIAGNVTIGDGADIGIGASVIQGVTIGEGAIIGGGACVIRDVPARTVAVGVPAQVIKEHDRW